jgi:hypothetical protein
MTYSFGNARDSLTAVSAPDTTAAGSRAAGGQGPGVPQSIWPGLPAPGGARDGLPCGGQLRVPSRFASFAAADQRLP